MENLNARLNEMAGELAEVVVNLEALNGLCTKLLRELCVLAKQGPQAQEVDPILLKTVDDLELRVRAKNGLKSKNIYNIGYLVQHSKRDLLNIVGLGPKSIDEIVEALANKGLTLGMRLENLTSAELNDRNKP